MSNLELEKESGSSGGTVEGDGTLKAIPDPTLAHLLAHDLGHTRHSRTVGDIADVVLDADLLLRRLVVAEDDNGRAALEHFPRKLEPEARRAYRQLLREL